MPPDVGGGRAVRKVLVADDTASVRHLLRAMLTRAVACEVLEAASGRAALELARTEHPFVVVLDLDMPELNGLEVCAALRADADTREMTILMLTGSPGDDVQGYAMAAGIDGFFAKPHGVRDLCETIASLASAQE